MDTRVERDLVTRYRADLRRACESCAEGSAQFALAVSGGPDSLALLLLTNLAFPGRFQVATVDHGLRRESAEEAQLVSAICAKLGVKHTTLAVTLADGNIQDRAREARYAALGEWARQRGLMAILTAHHADDQAETLLMRLNRGSGVRGLAGIRRSGRVGAAGVRVVRPLLEWRKRELESFALSAGLVPAQDPSNSDPRFDRVRMRQALAEADWLDPLAIARSAGYLAQAEEALEWIVEDVWKREFKARKQVLSWPDRDYPELVRVGLIERALAHIGGAGVTGDAARIHERLRDGGKANVAGVLVSHEKGVWTFAPEPARRTAQVR